MDYFIADLHLDHFNIIKYCNRPFKSVEEMNHTIVTNWNSIITPLDHVFLLGDFALPSRKDDNKTSSDRMKYLAKLLNGNITLVKGNHDRMSASFWRRLGWEYHKSDYVEWNGFLLSHRPVMWADKYNIHGHTHALVGRRPYINVSVECTGYKPVTLAYVNDIIGGWAYSSGG